MSWVRSMALGFLIVLSMTRCAADGMQGSDAGPGTTGNELLPARNVRIDGDARTALNLAGYLVGRTCIQLVGETSPFFEFSARGCPAAGRSEASARLFVLPVTGASEIVRPGETVPLGQYRAFSDEVVLYHLCTGFYGGRCSLRVDDSGVLTGI